MILFSEYIQFEVKPLHLATLGPGEVGQIIEVAVVARQVPSYVYVRIGNFNLGLDRIVSLDNVSDWRGSLCHSGY